jgi:hypothetical protein
MRTIKAYDTIEHRFIHAAGDEPKPQNDIAQRGAFLLDQAEVPDTDLVASVWRIPAGGEISVPDQAAEKILALKAADGHPYAGEAGTDLPQRDALVAPDPTDPADRTPREEAERAAADAGHTIEGEIRDHDKHREHARARGVEPGGPTAAAMAPRAAASAFRPAPPPPRAAAPAPAAPQSQPQPAGPQIAPRRDQPAAAQPQPGIQTTRQAPAGPLSPGPAPAQAQTAPQGPTPQR